MTTQSIPSSDISALLLALAHQRAPVEWLQWLPVATAAAESPELLAETFTALHLEDQYLLLGHLAQDNAGPLAQLIVLTLASIADHIQDAMIRDYLLEDAVAGLTRVEGSMEELRLTASTLAEAVGVHAEITTPGFDVALSIVRHRQQLTQLRRVEKRGTVELQELGALVRQIRCLETERSLLARYDETAAMSQLGQLQRKVGGLRTRKQARDAELAATTQELEVLQREDQRNSQTLNNTKRSIEDTRSQLEAMEHAAKSLREEIEQARIRQQQQQAELVRLRDERTKLGEQSQQTLDLLAAERTALTEIRTAAEVGGYDEISKRLEELFYMLPEDQADSTFRRTR